MSETAYKIETGIPVPTKQGKPSVAATLRALKPGESVLFPDKKITTISRECCVQVLRCGDGRSYTCRTVEGGVRAWRTA